MATGSRARVLVFALFFVIFLTLLQSPAVFAQAVTPVTGRAQAEQLTTALMALNAQYRSAGPESPESNAERLSELSALAAQRQQLLSSLMETNPGEVLRVAMPGSIRNTMPAQIQAFVEQRVQLQGTLEVSYEDSQSGAILHHVLTTASGRLSLHFASQPPTNLLTGSVVRVNGVKVQNGLALSSGSGSSSFQVVKAAALPNTFGPQSTLVILVNFQDNTSQPWTPQTAYGLAFGTGTGTVNGFYQDSSFGQTSLTGDVAGWYTLPLSSTTCNTSSIQTYAQQAAQNAGYVLSNYNRFVYAFPQTSACGWSGWSNIGGNPSNSWINGSMNLRVLAHELGHAFGLYHSHALSCTSGGVTVPYSNNCTSIEYGDQLDDMGSPYPMYFNASQKERLGWLNSGSSPPITTVSSSGSYTIAPYETQDSNPKALKILQSSSSNSFRDRNRRRSHASNRRNTEGVWQKPK